MKKLIILLGALLFSTTAYAQPASDDLMGVGMPAALAELLSDPPATYTSQGDYLCETDAACDIGAAATEMGDGFFDGTLTTDVLAVDETSTFTGNATFTADILSTADNTTDLGASGTELKDGFFDGTLTTDVLDVDETSTLVGNATFSANILANADNTSDIGASGTEFKDAFFDGTVTTDALKVDDADGGGISIKVNTVTETTDSGASTDTITGLIPAGALCLSVTCIVDTILAGSAGS